MTPIHPSRNPEHENQDLRPQPLDALLVLLALVQLAVLVYGVLGFGSVGWGTQPRPGPGLRLPDVHELPVRRSQLYPQPVLHEPAAEPRLRRVQLAAHRGPQSLYRIHHLHHHKYNNDAPDPETGTTKDLTSTWRYSPWPWREESFWSYALVGYFRSDFGFLLREAKRKGQLSRVIWESCAARFPC